MELLTGWKEIANCLHMTPRNARRWERLGLPVWRVSNGSRSPVVAFHDEIEHWVRLKKLRGCRSPEANTVSFGATGRESAGSNPNASELQNQLKRMRELREESRRLRIDLKLARENLWKGISRSFPQS